MRGTWVVLGALMALATGCGDASSSPRPEVAPEVPVARPTVVPAATGRVVTTSPLLVTDDGSGPRMCRTGNWQDVEPPSCDELGVTGLDWDTAGEVEEKDGVRWGFLTLTGTFDGSVFDVEAVSHPDPEPFVLDLEIPCPTPDGGWRVLDPASTTDRARDALLRTAEALPGHALTAVSTTDGEPGPRTAAATVVTVRTAGDVDATEAALREVWGGMLCVAPVEHSFRELERIQHELLDLPGMTEVGSGNADNQVELTVLHDDGSLQRWVDQEYGEGVVVVTSNLRPVR